MGGQFPDPDERFRDSNDEEDLHKSCLVLIDKAFFQGLHGRPSLILGSSPRPWQPSQRAPASIYYCVLSCWEGVYASLESFSLARESSGPGRSQNKSILYLNQPYMIELMSFCVKIKLLRYPKTIHVFP